jgi:hypothetical protein
MSWLNQRLPAEFLTEEHEIIHNLFGKQADAGWYLGTSEIQGKGIFASKKYEPGDTIGLAAFPGDEDEYGAKIWNLTELARYCNHQNENNANLKKIDGNMYLVAKKTINDDDEIFSSYSQVTRAIGPHSRMQWEGKDVPTSDLSDYIEKGNQK